MDDAGQSHRTSQAMAASAFALVFTLGIVNLFADMTYEGGASINGQFMGMLGASAAIISITAGIGEFLGYTVRAVSGYVADKTGVYWLITFVGYCINLLAVPAMALAGNWQVAAALILAERIGRAIRKPTIEAMLSYTTGALGRGWVYGLNTALDETGATLGPLLMAVAIYFHADYRTSYAWLLVSSILALAALTAARIIFPVPSQLQAGPSKLPRKFSGSYWLYMLAASSFGAGLMSFELIAYHLAQTGLVSDYWIPIFVAIATLASIVSSLTLGRLYDRVGMPVILAAIFASALFPPFVFLGGFAAMIVGMILWGIGYAVQDTLLKALVAGLLPEGRRNFAFGLFYTGYGVGWLVGSIATGILYEHSRLGMIVFAMAAQGIAIAVFIVARKMERHPVA